MIHVGEYITYRYKTEAEQAHLSRVFGDRGADYKGEEKPVCEEAGDEPESEGGLVREGRKGGERGHDGWDLDGRVMVEGRQRSFDVRNVRWDRVNIRLCGLCS
jgi:hypothetical protein